MWFVRALSQTRILKQLETKCGLKRADQFVTAVSLLVPDKGSRERFYSSYLADIHEAGGSKSMVQSLLFAALQEALFELWQSLGQKIFLAATLAFTAVTLPHITQSPALTSAAGAMAIAALVTQRNQDVVLRSRIQSLGMTTMGFYLALAVGQWSNFGGPVESHLPVVLLAIPALILGLTLAVSISTGRENIFLLRREQRWSIQAMAGTQVLAMMELVRIQLSSNAGPLHLMDDFLKGASSVMLPLTVSLGILAIHQLSAAYKAPAAQDKI